MSGTTILSCPIGESIGEIYGYTASLKWAIAVPLG